jgi:hypothetical protein
MGLTPILNSLIYTFLLERVWLARYARSALAAMWLGLP